MIPLVTGSSGFIGRAYCREHASIGIDIKTGNNIMDYLGGKIPECDGIIHLAAVSGILDSNHAPIQSLSTNIMGTAVMLDVARRIDKKIVIASSAAAEDPVNPYAAGKLSAEAVAVAYNNTYKTDYVCLRFANVYGPDSDDKSSVVAQMCRDALRDGIITVYGDGTQRRDFVYVDDIVKVLHGAATEDVHGLYAVGTGDTVNIIGLARYIQELSGANIVYKPSPRQETSPRPPTIRTITTTVPWFIGVKKTWGWYRDQDKT